MKLLILLGIIAVTLGVSAAQSPSCTAYTGTACSSVFGAASITSTSVGGSSFISTADSAIETNLAALSAVRASVSQDCLNYARLIQCLSVYTPCSGTAWCGSMSETELTDAVNTACGCSGSTCPILASGQVATIRNYYQGSSSTGQVGASLSCQDVTLATAGNAAGTMKMSVMGAALVAIFLSIGLLL